MCVIKLYICISDSDFSLNLRFIHRLTVWSLFGRSENLKFCECSNSEPLECASLSAHSAGSLSQPIFLLAPLFPNHAVLTVSLPRPPWGFVMSVSWAWKCSSTGDPQAPVLGSSRLCSEFIQLVTTQIDIYHPGHAVLCIFSWLFSAWYLLPCNTYNLLSVCLLQLICKLWAQFPRPQSYLLLSSVFSEIEDGWICTLSSSEGSISGEFRGYSSKL